MFKLFSAVFTVGAICVPAIHAEPSHYIQANIPFDFTVQSKKFAAGDYRLGYDDTSHVVSIRGVTQKSAGAMATTSPLNFAGGPGKLVFHCGKAGCALAQVWQGSQLGSFSLGLKANERQRNLSFVTRTVPLTNLSK